VPDVSIAIPVSQFSISKSLRTKINPNKIKGASAPQKMLTPMKLDFDN
jgi:hypothetical protein